MNCFQICIFVSDNTTLSIMYLVVVLLWIAFKFVSLYRIIQPVSIVENSSRVVNCFQICIFVSDNTTGHYKGTPGKWLWIAFKFVSLYRIIQHGRCLHDTPLVVNCFQICIFVSDNTTNAQLDALREMLWIAFKFVSLYRIIQRVVITDSATACCELLSNLYLCIG